MKYGSNTRSQLLQISNKFLPQMASDIANILKTVLFLFCLYKKYISNSFPQVLSVIFLNIRPIYIGKNQNPKNLGFLLYRLHCQKNP